MKTIEEPRWPQYNNFLGSNDAGYSNPTSGRPNLALNNFEPKIHTSDKLYSPSHHRYVTQLANENTQGVVPAPGKAYEKPMQFMY